VVLVLQAAASVVGVVADEDYLQPQPQPMIKSTGSAAADNKHSCACQKVGATHAGTVLAQSLNQQGRYRADV
jgi:hypothetical protein